MHPDREAFIAGIAADPDNDLRRLVFADWLEEHGEAERAEFIRLQIEEPTLSEGDVKNTVVARARQLFVANGPQWFGPLLTILEPTRDVATGYRWDRGFDLTLENTYRSPSGFLLFVNVRRGFVERVSLDLSRRVGGCSLTDAFQTEPVARLAVALPDNPRQWRWFSQPALNRIAGLGLEPLLSGTFEAALPAVFDDRHLSAVRTLDVTNRYRVARFGREPLSTSTVTAFVNSQLAERVTELGLSLNDAGLRQICSSTRLRLRSLRVTGTVTQAGIASLSSATFAGTLRALTLHAAELNDDTVAALAKVSTFPNLVGLDLSVNYLTDAGVRALASAPFVQQLESLDLSTMSQKYGSRDLPGLCALAEALNPDRLRRLRFASNGCKTVPPCLAKFGDRVVLA